MRSKEYVVGLGEVLWDYLPDEEPRPGGAPAIFAYHAAQCGFAGAIISSVGEDDSGTRLTDKLHNHFVEFYGEVKPGYKTGTAIVSFGKDKERRPQYQIDTAAAWKDFAFRDDYIKIAKKCRALYFDCLAEYCGKKGYRNLVEGFIKYLPKKTKCYRLFDLNFRYNGEKKLYNYDAIRWGVKTCNVLKINKRELKCVSRVFKLAGFKREREKCKALMHQYANIEILILTKGSEGSTVYWKEESTGIRIFSSEMPSDVRNTVGAGDAFAGAFIGSLQSGHSYIEAYDLAVSRAKLVCDTGISMPPIPLKGVFVSYSTEDSRIVDVFLDRLKALDIKVWRDEEKVNPGAPFRARIVEAIKECEVFLLFSSASSNASVNVESEVKEALTFRKHIYVIRIDNAPLNKEYAVALSKLSSSSILKSGVERIVRNVQKLLS